MKGSIFKSLVVAVLALASHLVHAGTVTYVYTDPQGTPLAEANASGAITATFDYKPYGSQVLGSPKAGPGYTGHVNDPDTGFVYMQARYYDPVVGRFLGVDPISVNSTENFNRYSYASNNPILNIDPDGKNACGTNDDSGCNVTITLQSRVRDAGGKYNDSFTGDKNSKNYNAIATVTVNGKPAGTFMARTLPSSQKRFATLKDGTYPATRTFHKGKYPAIAINGNRAVPTVGPNPAHPSVSLAMAIQIHRAGPGNYTGVLKDGSGVSEGCQLIARDEYKSFLTATGVVPKEGAPQKSFTVKVDTNENK